MLSASSAFSDDRAKLFSVHYMWSFQTHCHFELAMSGKLLDRAMFWWLLLARSFLQKSTIEGKIAKCSYI